MNPLHLIWIIPILLFAGFQIGSIVEKLKGYNFADLEYDALNALEGKLSADEKQIARKVLWMLNAAEFWKKAK